MSADGPREVVTGFFSDINRGRPEAAFARISPEVIYHIIAPPPYGGVMDLRTMQGVAGAVFEKLAAPLKVQLGTIVADGTRVVAEVTSRAPTKVGGEYANKYLFLYRVEDGLIVEAKEYLDSAMLVALMEDRL